MDFRTKKRKTALPSSVEGSDPYDNKCGQRALDPWAQGEKRKRAGRAREREREKPRPAVYGFCLLHAFWHPFFLATTADMMLLVGIRTHFFLRTPIKSPFARASLGKKRPIPRRRKHSSVPRATTESNRRAAQYVHPRTALLLPVGNQNIEQHQKKSVPNHLYIGAPCHRHYTNLVDSSYPSPRPREAAVSGTYPDLRWGLVVFRIHPGRAFVGVCENCWHPPVRKKHALPCA